MTNINFTQNYLATILMEAKKFNGFTTPASVAEKVNLAASKLEIGQEQEAGRILREVNAELTRALRAFIDNSPSFLAAQLAAMKDLDLGLKQRLNMAIMQYSRDVKGAGWEPAAMMYNTVSGLLAGAPAASDRIKAAKAAEIKRRIDEACAAQEDAEAARQEEERRAAADAAQKAQAEKKAAAEKAARHETAEKLRKMVARKAA